VVGLIVAAFIKKDHFGICRSDEKDLSSDRALHILDSCSGCVLTSEPLGIRLGGHDGLLRRVAVRARRGKLGARCTGRVSSRSGRR